MSEVTRILSAMEDGDPQAAAQLLPVVYDDLRRLAVYLLAKEKPGQTLQATALVHEAWLKLDARDNHEFNNSAHYFRAAAEAMRRILIDNARRKQALRHGGGLHQTELDTLAIVSGVPDDELLKVNDALDALAAHEPRKADVVKLRFIVGLSIEETARALGISEPTAKRDWVYARAWLYREISKDGQPSSS